MKDPEMAANTAASQIDPKKVKIRIDHLSLSFGGVKALTDISIDVKEGEILAIIGPNGAGKTCVLNCINGFYKPQKGEIYFEGQRITRIRPDKAAKLGLARTFQNIELYSGLRTLDNLMAGMNLEEKEDIVRFILDVYEGQGDSYPDTPVLRDGIRSIVMVEHDMGVVMDICDRIAVLNFGRKIADGPAAEIQRDPQVMTAYLGGAEER